MNKIRRFLLKPFDFLFNYRLKRYCLGPHAIEVIGARGVGKSTIYALIAEEAKKKGMKVYCQYPYEGCYQIPVIKEDQGRMIKEYTNIGKSKPFKRETWIPHEVWVVDKDWLYNTDFSNCVVLLDEARTIYPARQYQNWTISDDEFFNFLRHLNVTVYLSSQEHDALDLNVRRAVDETWFLYKSGNSPFTHVAIYSSMTVPIENLQKRVKLKGQKEMYQLDWDICSSLQREFIFYRPPYYNLFDTNFVYDEKVPAEVDLWDKLLNS